MELKNKEWLNHLTTSIPKEAYGYTVSLYSVALEGWRRGLSLRFRNLNRSKAQTVFFLSDGKKEHRFAVTRGDKVPRKAIQTCIDKGLTKKHLIESNVPTPEGQTFKGQDTNEEIIAYANEQGYPLVIKPLDGTGGEGVIANIKDISEFKHALSYVREKLNYKEIIVEKHFEGIDCRVYVIDNRVIGAIKRIQANVIGDGVSSISQLIKIREKERFKNPALYGRVMKIDSEVHNLLKQQGYNIESIPNKGERVFLKTKNNVSAGGESIDITDELTEEIKQIAIDAAGAIPGLVQCGVDLMVNFNSNTASVIEINSRPHITAQLFPEEGKARNIPKAIIDYYFPETKANYEMPLYYFDYNHVWKSFETGRVKEITIPNVPHGNLVNTNLIVSGRIQRVHYGAWVRRQARELSLNGYIKHLENKAASIVISGKKDLVEKFKTVIKTDTCQKEIIENVKETTYNKPIKISFEIINPELDTPLRNGYYPVRLEGIRRELTPSRNKNSMSKNLSKSKVNKERSKYKEEYKKLVNSTSWKITKPLRSIRKMFQ